MLACSVLIGTMLAAVSALALQTLPVSSLMCLFFLSLICALILAGRSSSPLMAPE